MIGRVGQVLEQVASVQRASVMVDGVRVRYTRAGSGPALVLVHGLVGSSQNWNESLECLAQFRTVYAPDLVNMGESARVAGLDPGLVAQVERLKQWMDALGIGAADVVGHSHGGAISMLLATWHPERVRKLVLFAPANPYCELGRPQIRFYGTFVGGVFARRVIPLLPRVLYRRSLERTWGDPTRVGPGVLEGYTDYLDRPAITHIVDIMRGWDGDMALIEAALPKLAERPMLLIWGDRDRVVGLDSGRKLAGVLGAELRVIASGGHTPFQELPEESNAMLIGWLLDRQQRDRADQESKAMRAPTA